MITIEVCELVLREMQNASANFTSKRNIRLRMRVVGKSAETARTVQQGNYSPIVKHRPLWMGIEIIVCELNP
jgi:hypothetical protein